MFDFEAIPVHWANRLSFLSRKQLTGRFTEAGFDITAEEWATLLQLWACDGRSHGELAALTVRDRTTVTRLVDRLVKKGVVERRSDPSDRRRSEVVLTPTGRSLRGQLVPLAQGLLARAFDGISPEELVQTTRVLRAMTANLERE